jgi:hypothetical protein
MCIFSSAIFMKNTRFTKILVLMGGILTFALSSCAATSDSPSPDVPETTATTTQKPPENPPAPVEKDTSAGNSPQVSQQASQNSSQQISQEFHLAQYNNEDWQIAVVEAQGLVTYYGCRSLDGACQTAMNGQKKCEGDVCVFDWTMADQTTLTLEISATSKKLIIKKAGALSDSGELRQSEPSTNLISSDQEYVAGVTGKQLEVLVPQIQQAVFEKDWQAIADLSVAEVNVNYHEGARSTKVANGDLAKTLAAANLDNWTARVMTTSFDELFLNQYGAMLGSGAIWINTGANETTPKIYSINIF